MSWFWYGIEFNWNKIIGYSIFQEQIEIIGYIIVSFAILFGFLSMIRIFQNYRETRRKSTLYLGLAYIFFIAAGVFLIIEKIYFSYFCVPELGALVASIATIFCGIATIFGLRFVFLTIYYEYTKILTIVSVALTTIWVGVVCFGTIIGPPNADIQHFELIYTPIISIVVYVIYVPLLAIATGKFYSYTLKMRNEDRANSNRLFWLSTGILLFFLGVMMEIAPIFFTILSIPFRIFLFLGTFLMYLCFSLPKWFKNKIGWKELVD